MDWIERWFGVSPDGGDGSIEIVLAIVFLAAAAAVVAAAFPDLPSRAWRALVRARRSSSA